MPDPSIHVGVVLLDIADLRGGGGAERCYAEFVQRMQRRALPGIRVSFISDPRSLTRLAAVGLHFKPGDAHVLAGEGPCAAPGHAVGIAACARAARLDVVHFPLISPHYLPYLWARTWWPWGPRPAITISQVDANLSHVYEHRGARHGAEQHKTAWLHRIYFQSVRLAGIFSWYEAFVALSQRIYIRGRPLVRAARFCGVDTQRFAPAAEKRKRLVFVARMIPAKRPLLFIEAVAEAVRRDPAVFAGWQVCMYGDGPLLPQVRARVVEQGLAALVAVPGATELAAELAVSEIFVSTQERENFSSIAMLEAMACGNAVIACDVGQTRMFVRDGESGIAVRDDDAGSLAAAILRMISNPDLRARCQRRSREICLDEHCPENFIADLAGFWREVAARTRS